jgi:isopentenyl-diphosphate Delta-isomerase
MMNDLAHDRPPLILVDPEDQILGYASQALCHDGGGLRHRAVSVFIADSHGRILLQQRSVEKLLWPNHWSNSCCGHPWRGETYEVAAARRLREELGLSPPLILLFKFTYHALFGDVGSEHEICTVFIGRDDTPPEPDHHEIHALRYAYPEDIDLEIDREPERFTPWFLIEWITVRCILKEGDMTR